jgi:signal transduction histidine kinase
VKDSGIGIAKENIGKLFHNFCKLVDTKGLNSQGTGLGLSICKHIIEKMGGSVRVESEGENQGTSFIIKLSISS